MSNHERSDSREPIPLLKAGEVAYAALGTIASRKSLLLMPHGDDFCALFIISFVTESIA